jgi:ferredoxin
MKYYITINQDLCIDCCVTIGACPPHARTLSRSIGQYCEYADCQELFLGVFPEELYPCIKQAADACPMHAIIITALNELIN